MKSILKNFGERLSLLLRGPSILWMGFYVIFVSIWIIAFWKYWAYDDPFITYRYAGNLAHGLGFVYNPGERVLSTTTPFFTLLLAGISLLGKNIPLAANLVGAISVAVGAVFLFDIARSQKSPIVSWAALLLYPCSSMILMTIGSETPVYIALALASFAFYFRQNFLLTAIFSALLLLTRPDGVIVPAILVMDYLIIKRQSVPWKAVGIFLIIVVPWFGFSWLYFGSPIPSTLFVKQQQGVMPVSYDLAGGIIRTAKAQLAHWQDWFILGIAAVGFIRSIFFSRGWWAFLAWPLLYFVSYTILGVATYFWYYAPLIPGYIVLIGLGLTVIYEGLRHLLDQAHFREGWDILFRVSIVTVAMMGITVHQFGTAVRTSKRIDERYGIYQKVGEWLSNNTQPEDKVGTLEVGIIGYFSQRPMVDFAGLIQPEVAKQMSQASSYNDTAAFAIQRYQPQYLALRDGQLPKLEGTVVSTSCTPTRRFKGSDFGNNLDMTVYSCIYP